MTPAFPRPTPRAKPPRKPLSRSSLKRGGPIKRKAWMARGKGIKRRSTRTVVDVERRDWCRSQPCIAGDMGSPHAFTGPCSPRIEPHHAGKNPGLGKRAPEDTVVPLCSRHHRAITGQIGGYGMFEAMGKERRREMQDRWIADTTARYLSAGSRRSR